MKGNRKLLQLDGFQVETFYEVKQDPSAGIGALTYPIQSAEFDHQALLEGLN